MKYEFHAQFSFALQDSVTQGFAIPWLVGQSERLPAHWGKIALLQDPFARLNLLAQAIVTGRKEEARMGTRKMGGGYRFWVENRAAGFLRRQRNFMHQLGVEPSLPALTALPTGAWAIQFAFTLRKPYISKDDTDFYILDNPVKKEWVFKVPYVAPSQWKGALRAAMMRDLVSDLQTSQKDEEQFVAERLRLYRLFGNEKDGSAEFLNRGWALRRVGPCPETEAEKATWEENYRRTLAEVARQFDQRVRDYGYRVGDIEGFQGCLHFYPTYFDRISLEVINPHPRDTGAGKQPIYFECVPAGAEGTFTLLYVPPTGPEMSPDEAEQQAAEDLQVVVAGIEAMMTRYGFGAKTSSGYGVVEEVFAKDQLGKSQAIIRIRDGKGFRCRSFTGLRQAAAKLAEEWGDAA